MKDKKDNAVPSSEGGIKTQGPRQRVTLDFSLDELYMLINGMNELAAGLERLATATKCACYGRKAAEYRALAQNIDLKHSILFEEQNPKKFEFNEGKWSLAK